MCSVFKPTQDATWVRNQFGVDLPEHATTDVYPGHLAPIIVKSRHFAVVLADGFYEPCYESGRVVSFTMLTINANDHPVMRRFHKPEDEKRTPVVLSADNYLSWLDATPDSARELLRLELMPELSAES